MTEAAQKLPNKSVVNSLWSKLIQVKEKTSAIAGELGERVRHHVENSNLHSRAWRTAGQILSKGERNEIAALEEISHLRVYLDWVEERIKAKGHVGDLAHMAEKPEADVVGLDEARKHFEASAHKAPTPEEVDEKASKRKRTRKPKEDAREFGEELRETIATGDEHIRRVASGEPPSPLEGATGQGSYKIAH